MTDDDARPIVVVFMPREKRRTAGRVALWLGIPAGVIAATAALCAAILIAPGVLVGGVDVGWRTPGAASVLVSQALAETEVTLQTPGKTIVLTGAELGLTVDAQAATALAHGEYPLWNVGAWNPGNVPIEVAVDPAAATAALSSAAPNVYLSPVNARVRFDTKLAEFAIEKASSGVGLDFDDLGRAVSVALSEGDRTVTFDADPVPVKAAVSTAQARAEADTLNELVETAGFYVDGKKVLAVEPAVVASWISVGVVDDALHVDIDTADALVDMRKVVASLAKKANRAAVNEIIVTNAAGDHLRTVQAGVDGWKVGSTVGIAADFVEAFAAGDGSFELEGTDIAYTTTLAHRTLEVNKTTGQTILYENGRVVDTYSIAVGRPETPTFEGRFTIYAQLPLQDMGCVPGYDYCTQDVPWISYFDGDNGFHGTYWHDNFGAGAMMSHGCVNMTISDAERVFRFAQIGTEVWVHS